MTFKARLPKKLKLCVVILCVVVKRMVNVYSKYQDIPRICYCCGSTNTSTKLSGKPRWHLNLPTNLMLCHICYSKYIQNPKSRIEGYYRRLINFKGKEILLKTNPRKGFCQLCGKTGYTHLHHTQYDDVDVLRHTVELCPSCHAKEGWRLRQLVSRIKE